MTAAPQNQSGSGGGDGRGPSIEVARGVIRFEPDLSRVNDELDRLEERLERLRDGASALFQPPQPGAAPGGDEPGARPTVGALFPHEEIADLLRQQLDVMRDISDAIRQQAQDRINYVEI